MKDWICKECGQEVLSTERPLPINWTDGHVCRFWEEREDADVNPRLEKED